MSKLNILFIVSLFFSSVYSQNWSYLGYHDNRLQMIESGIGFKVEGQPHGSHGASACVYKTIEDWYGWNQMTSPNLGCVSGSYGCCSFSSIYFLNTMTGVRSFLNMGAEQIEVTYDGGASWSFFYNDYLIVEDIPQLVSDSLIIAYGNLPGTPYYPSKSIIRSERNNAQSIFQFDSLRYIENGFEFADENVGFIIVKDTNQVYYCFGTINSGASWNFLLEDTINEFSTLKVLDQNTVFLGTKNGKVFKTNDGGLNWIELITPTIQNINSIDFINPDTGFVACDSSVLLMTTDGGINWLSQNVGMSGDITNINIVDQFNVYCKVNYRHLFKKYLYLSTSDYDFSHLLVYPNPTNDIINIDFGRKINRAKVLIIDLSGKVLYNDELSNGTMYKLNLNLNDGVYILKIESKNSSIAKRIIIQ